MLLKGPVSWNGTPLVSAMALSVRAMSSSLASSTFAAAVQCSEWETWHRTPLASAMVLSAMVVSSSLTSGTFAAAAQCSE